ncbi:hypothetical protein AAFF_G00141450 [Aldrovandia affinis]|uniref:Uncharacterized protein n=1 Tax=Aldrovandia affinis TaxID=143900 RepID=A0AAD7X284_9TELE|nr:hypothetical protein AAFF_G00141450 [Aldrovandia affinis]
MTEVASANEEGRNLRGNVAKKGAESFTVQCSRGAVSPPMAVRALHHLVGVSQHAALRMDSGFFFLETYDGRSQQPLCSHSSKVAGIYGACSWASRWLTAARIQRQMSLNHRPCQRVPGHRHAGLDVATGSDSGARKDPESPLSLPPGASPLPSLTQRSLPVSAAPALASSS